MTLTGDGRGGRARQAGRPGAEARGAAGRLAGRAGGADRAGLGAGQAHRLALPGPAPPRPAADLRGADDGRARDARVLARGGLHRAALAEADGLGERVGGGAVQGRVLRPRAPTSRSRRSSTSRWRWRRASARCSRSGPVFRANPSFTSRHDTEFTSVDVEISWIDSHEDVMAFEERWLAHVLAAVKERPRRADPRDVRHRADRADRAVPADDASSRPRSCCASTVTTRPGAGHDLDPPSERALSAIVKERTATSSRS